MKKHANNRKRIFESSLEQKMFALKKWGPWPARFRPVKRVRILSKQTKTNKRDFQTTV